MLRARSSAIRCSRAPQEAEPPDGLGRVPRWRHGGRAAVATPRFPAGAGPLEWPHVSLTNEKKSIQAFARLAWVPSAGVQRPAAQAGQGGLTRLLPLPACERISKSSTSHDLPCGQVNLECASQINPQNAERWTLEPPGLPARVGGQATDKLDFPWSDHSPIKQPHIGRQRHPHDVVVGGQVPAGQRIDRTRAVPSMSVVGARRRQDVDGDIEFGRVAGFRRDAPCSRSG